MTDELARLVEEHHDVLLRYVRRHAGRVLLRFEAVEDLVSGIQVQALAAADSFERRSDEEFRAWLFTLARRALGRRREHWFALKRSGGRLVRLTLTGDDGASTWLPLAARETGPATLADRRDLLVLATKALHLLADRDRELIEAAVAGVGRQELAARLGMTPEAAERARLRAYERLRKTYRLLERARTRGTG